MPKPQGPPNDWKQWGPRLGLAYSFDVGDMPAVFRANWGLYYAQIPAIFFNAPTSQGQTGRQLLLLQPGLHA